MVHNLLANMYEVKFIVGTVLQPFFPFREVPSNPVPIGDKVLRTIKIVVRKGSHKYQASYQEVS